jgi:hypothetical protein
MNNYSIRKEAILLGNWYVLKFLWMEKYCPKVKPRPRYSNFKITLHNKTYNFNEFFNINRLCIQEIFRAKGLSYMLKTREDKAYKKIEPFLDGTELILDDRNGLICYENYYNAKKNIIQTKPQRVEKDIQEWVKHNKEHPHIVRINTFLENREKMSDDDNILHYINLYAKQITQNSLKGSKDEVLETTRLSLESAIDCIKNHLIYRQVSKELKEKVSK